MPQAIQTKQFMFSVLKTERALFWELWLVGSHWSLVVFLWADVNRIKS